MIVTKNNLDVFISSAQDEFSKTRIYLEKKISEMLFLKCQLLERRGAQPNNTHEASLEAAAICDIYIGIFGKQYSTLTIKEYKKAHSNNKPILIYIKDSKNRDAQLEKFIEVDIKNNYKYEQFKNLQDLCKKIKHDLLSYLFVTINDGITRQQEIKKKVKNIEKQKTKILSIKKDHTKQYGTLLTNIQKQLNQKMFAEVIVNSASTIELILRQKISLSIPNIENESFEQVMEYAKNTNIIQDKLHNKIRHIFYVRNELTHKGIVPTPQEAKLIFNMTKQIVRVLEKLSAKPVKWIVGWNVDVSKILNDKNFKLPSTIEPEYVPVTEWLQEKLLNYLTSNKIKFEIVQDYRDGEFFGISLSFYPNKENMTKMPIIDFPPFELVELQPYVTLYGDDDEESIRSSYEQI